MADQYLINLTTLQAIADSIKDKIGKNSSETIKVSDMATLISGIATGSSDSGSSGTVTSDTSYTTTGSLISPYTQMAVGNITYDTDNTNLSDEICHTLAPEGGFGFVPQLIYLISTSSELLTADPPTQGMVIMSIVSTHNISYNYYSSSSDTTTRTYSMTVQGRAIERTTSGTVVPYAISYGTFTDSYVSCPTWNNGSVSGLRGSYFWMALA